MKKVILALFPLLLFKVSFAQQYSLYNTRTLFDSFENPAQKAFHPDTSRQFAFNFFIPSFGFNAAMGGEAKSSFKALVFNDVIDASQLTIGQRKKSRAFVDINTYLLMFRVFKSVNGNKELGLSWQVRSDNHLSLTNESIAIFDDYKYLDQGQLSDLFKNKVSSQSYHQISLTYRKDIDRQLGVGVKFSYLSGVAYNDLKVNSTDLNIDTAANYYDLYLNGRLRTNFLYDDTIGKKFFVPAFKNPGAGITASINYHLPKGWYLIANLKDLGFIKWSNESYNYSLDRDISIGDASDSDADARLADELNFHSAYSQKGFITPTNAKAEILVSKDLGYYQPNLLLSKSLFYNDGNVALLNNFKYKQLNLSLSTVYNTSNIIQVGSQFMVRSPNTEFYIGSDQLFKTIGQAKAIAQDNPDKFKGYPGASFYFGFSAKFGYIIEHPMNANRIPHFNDGKGIISRILRKLGLQP